MHCMLLSIDWSFFDKHFAGEKVSNYIWFAGIVLGTILLKRPLAMLLARIGKAMTEHFSKADHKPHLQIMLRSPLERLLQIILYYIAVNQLSGLLDRLVIHHLIGSAGHVTVRVGDIVDHIFLFFFIIFFTQVVSRIVDFAFRIRLDKAHNEQNRSRQQLLPLVNEMANLLLWTLSTFWILGSVFHVNIPALITGLGIGGIAIALAGKETVENLFAAFTILTDKPFQTGEMIKLGDFEGTVERIGFRSTRVRNADGSMYIIPNQMLVGQNLVNLSQRDTRGVKLVINIKYGPSHEAVQKIIDELKAMIQKTLHVRQPLSVTLESFNENAFQIVVNYTLPNPLPAGITDVAIKQSINLQAYDIVTRYAGPGSSLVTAPPQQ